ncbi:multidrug effflux MFS transporter [Paraglaciecola sp. 2405UD69-4]|uniref:multidrug effflux MFS transporter n=1 Tax=Paraglaciecola sp. 2405UD69-4 TaxID=3391836 RepID=UPI0039C96745
MTRKSLLPLLILMVLFSPLAIDIFLPALPVMAQDLSVSLVTMGWSVTIFLLSLGLGQLISGPLADRYGRKPVALGGVVVYGLSSALIIFASNIELVLAARLLQGFGACAIVVAAFACVRDRYDAIQSGVMYSYLNGAICCIPALAPLLGNLLTEYFGWRSNFQFMAGYAIFAGLIIAFSLTETQSEKTPNKSRLINVTTYFSILKHPVFLFNALVVMLAMAIIIAYVTTAPGWLMVNLQLARSEFVFWFSLNAVFNVAASLLAPKALLKWGPRISIGLGMLVLIVSGLLMMALMQWHHPAGFMIPIILSSIGFSLVMGACAGQALAPFGDKAGTASALLGFIQMTGASIIVGLLQSTDLNAVWQLIILMLSILPIYCLYKMPSIKTKITFNDNVIGHNEVL